MVTQTLTPALESLLDRLDALTRRARVAELRDWLEQTAVSLDDVSRFARFGERNYLRNLVRGGTWYHLLVICWRSGQRSPIHNHTRSTCGLKILTGTATETSFEFTPCGLIKATESHELNKGDVAATQDEQIHQISNLRPIGEDLVTMHVYSPPLLRMDTYSLVDSSIGEYAPVIMEHSMGSGI